jgi:hypothetical protein
MGIHSGHRMQPREQAALRARQRVKLFDRLKHYYTSIGCWTGGSGNAVALRHRFATPASLDSLPSRPPPVPILPAALPFSQLVWSASHRGAPRMRA